MDRRLKQAIGSIGECQDQPRNDLGACHLEILLPATRHDDLSVALEDGM